MAKIFYAVKKGKKYVDATTGNYKVLDKAFLYVSRNEALADLGTLTEGESIVKVQVTREEIH